MDMQHDLLVGRRWRAHCNVVHAAFTHGHVGLTDWFSIWSSIAWFSYWLLFLFTWEIFLSRIKHTQGSRSLVFFPQAQTSLLLPVCSWKWAGTICDCLNILSHRLPAGICAAVSFLPLRLHSLEETWNNCSCQLKRIGCSCPSRTIGGQPLTTSMGWAACDLLLYVWCFHARKWNRCSNILNAFSLYLPAKYLRCEDGNMMSSLNNCWRQVMILVML